MMVYTSDHKTCVTCTLFVHISFTDIIVGMSVRKWVGYNLNIWFTD